MMGLSFLAPLALAGLLALPILWRLLRVTPPRPREVDFPPLILIRDVVPKEEQPARTPPWLLALRLIAAALLILAVAGPIWSRAPGAPGGTGPLLIVMDDGWAAAHDWERRVTYAQARLAGAGRDGRQTALAAISEGGRAIALADSATTLERLRALKPQPRKLDRAAALPALTAFLSQRGDAELVWIADGVAQGVADEDPRAFAAALAGLPHGSAEVATSQRPAVALAGAENAPQALSVRVLRAEAGGPNGGVVRALDLRGAEIGAAPFDFGSANETQARFDIPLELRNDVARLDVQGMASAGAVALLDDRWKRRRVMIVAETSAETAQPLLAAGYYLTRALGPFADAREAPGPASIAIPQALDQRPAVIALADVGALAGETHDALARFVEEGGVLLRFAGPRLAANPDDLIPVRLRRGGRSFGGALSWDKPKTLAPFERESPFHGLPVSKEITASRQVLAEPEPGLAQKTWAALEDGTPLVTAEKRGAGVIVLVHVTADTTWSNLPISGLFVDMLRRVVAQGRQAASEATTKGAAETREAREATLIAPTRTLDGFGVFGAPPPTAKPIPADFSGEADADHPPGFYGPPDALVAVNVTSPGESLRALDLSALPATRAELARPEPVDLRPPLFLLAFLLLALDALASAWASGLLRRPRGAATAAVALTALAGLIVAGLASFATPARAQVETRRSETTRSETMSGDATRLAQSRFDFSRRGRATRALSDDPALTTRLAYVVTGDGAVDEASRLGLAGLSRALQQRTALEPGEPKAVDPARDDLSFYPLIYWPIVAGRPQPPQAARDALALFMKNGGTIVFDTRDGLTYRVGAQTPEREWLKRLLLGVDVPALEPVPADHVVTKTFYLIQGFPGRTADGETWIEALPPASADGAQRPARAGDSVSPIVIASNDLAAAWAETANGEPLYPLTPGGRRQRELALRGGVNLVMYTLTGNYKADQVHVRDLLRRLER
jgi:hypothetical protein